MRPIYGVLLVCSLLAGCLAISTQNRPQQVTRYVPRQSTGTVFVANGSGDAGLLSLHLDQALCESASTLHQEDFDWSHGKGEVLADHLDRENHQYQANRLVEQIRRYQRASGGQHVYLLAHSSGCAIVLAAAEQMPANSIEKLVLLAPSVPDTYDLRPALRATRLGIESYHSREDQFILGLVMAVLGTTEPESRTAAGLYGFKLMQNNPSDGVLYQKLRQHHWDESVRWSGHDGNHVGAISTGFLKAYVLKDLVK